MTSLDAIAETQGVKIVGNERLPKGQNTVENVGRVIAAARALEKAAAAEREQSILQRESLKDKLLEKEEAINDLRKLVAELRYELDAFKRRQRAEQAGLTIAQRSTLGIESSIDAAAV